MDKVKKSLGISMLGLISCCLIGSSAIFFTGQKTLSETSLADIDAIFQNSVQEWFTSNISDKQDLFFAPSNVPIELKFNTNGTKKVSVENGTTGEIEEKKYSFYTTEETEDNATPTSFYAFSDINFSLSRNGNLIDLPDDNTIVKNAEFQTAQGFVPANFDMKLSLTTGNTNVQLKPDSETNHIVLYQEGVYTLNIQYRSHYTTDGGEYFENEEIHDLSYTFYLFNKNTYLGDDNAPGIQYSSFDRTATGQDATQYNYFYNYQSKTSGSLTYDPSKFAVKISKDNSVLSLTYDQETNSVISEGDAGIAYNFNPTEMKETLYFYQLGEYRISFEMIYITADNQRYTLPDLNNLYPKDQKVYVYGFNALYTKYDTATNTNTYPELKKYNPDFSAFTDAADVSNQFVGITNIENIDLSSLTPTSTNQVPVKFEGNATLNDSQFTIYNVGKDEHGNTTLSNKTQNQLSKTFSTPGTYFAVLDYTFENLTTLQGSKDPTHKQQYFYFTITNEAPNVDVYIKDNEDNFSLLRKAYTNKDVYIEPAKAIGEFDEKVIITVSRYDFESRATTTRYLSPKFAGNRNIGTWYNKTEERYSFNENGTYTISWYHGRNGENGTAEKIVFTIDKETIAKPEALTLIERGSNYIESSTFDTFTNQPFVFSWATNKESGANVFGYVRYYSLQEKSLTELSSAELQYYANTLNTIPVGYMLDLSKASSWNYYENAVDLKSFSKQDGRIRRNAGLYVLRLQDEAGNSTTKLFVLDNTTPNFVLNTPDTNGQPFYELLSTSTKKLSQDAEVYWGQNKGIYFTAPENAFFNNRDNTEDASIQAAYTEFSKYIENLSVLGKPMPTLKVPINKRAYIQDEHKGETSAQYVDNVYSYTIDYSYSLYYTGPNPDLNNSQTKFYYSTSTQGIFREAINLQTGERGKEQIIASSLGGGRYAIDDNELVEYKGTRYTATFDLTDLSYTFYIRDNSNTSGYKDEYGYALSERTTYLQYPSTSKRITVSSDASQLEFQVEGKALPADGISSYTGSLYEENEIVLPPETGTNTNNFSGYKYKNVYYYPTYSQNVINLSFIPTVNDKSGKIIQVEKIMVEYTPYAVQYSSSIKGNKVITTAYRTFGQPETAYPIYNYKDEEQTTTTDKENSAKNIPLNVVSQYINGTLKQLTAEGRYVITRKYAQPKADNTFSVDKYDFFYRTITLYVDRAGAISEAEPIEYAFNELTFGDDIKLAYANDALYSNTSLKGAQNNYVQINETGATTRDITEYTLTGSADGYQYVYIFDTQIKTIKLLNNRGVEQSLTEVGTERTTSIQSVVGNSVLVNMYAGNEKRDVAVQFPTYNEVGINNGDSLFTQTDAQVFATNKLPLTINIPSSKYTYGPVYNYNTNSFSTNANSDLMQYHGTFELLDGTQVSAASISQYNISAEILFNDGEKKYTSQNASAGYLTFQDENGNAANSFTAPGLYTVKLIQSAEFSDFRAESTFSFRILSQSPEFEIVEENSRRIQTSAAGEYYTNKKVVVATWQDSDNRLITNIDKKQIFFSFKDLYNTDTTLRLALSESGLQVYNANGTPASSTYARAFSYSSSGNNNELKIDLALLGIYGRQGSFQLSMQFEGHDENYQITTKTLNVDIQADSSTIDELISKIPQLKTNNLRRHLNIDGDRTAGLYSYDVSSNTDRYKYFAYTVNEAFFNKLADKDQSGSLNSTSSVYIKEITYNNLFEETEYGNFVSSTYDRVETAKPENYYEIVESDLAGNLTIYTVYYHSDEDKNIGLEITTNEDSATLEISDKEITSNKYNIYAYEGAVLQNINFHGDKWLFFNINSTRYMKSPQLQEDEVLNLATGKEENINSLLSSLTSAEKKNVITIYDKTNGESYNIYLSIVRASNLNITPMSEGEGINISVSGNPSGDNVSFFPTKIVIEKRVENAYSPVAQLTNNPNDADNLSDASYNYTNATSWIGDAYEEYSIAYQNGWQVQLNNPVNNTKYRYTITDNFGKVWPSVVHLYGSRFTDEIDSSHYSVIEDGETWFKLSKNFVYSYNPNVYTVEASPIGNSANITPSTERNRITAGRGYYDTLTLAINANSQPNDRWRVIVKEEDTGDTVKEFFIHFYNVLPLPVSSGETTYSVKFTNNNGIDITSDFAHLQTQGESISLAGKDYRINYSGTAYAGNLTVDYTSAAGLPYPYKAVAYSFDNPSYADGAQLTSGDKLPSGATYYLLFTYNNVFVNEYMLYKLTINDPDDSFFFVEYNGVRIEASNQTYTSINTGKEYTSNYYIINSSNTQIRPTTNTYQKVNVIGQSSENSKGITTIIYHLSNFGFTGVSPFDDYVVISYIPQSTSFGSFHFGSSNAFKPISSSSINFPDLDTAIDVDSMQVRWSKYYGIPSNIINLSVLKDGKAFYPTITENDSYFFATLNISGSYKLKFTDEAGNTRLFNGQEELNISFIKDVHFTMTHVQNGEEIETEAINKGVFNGWLKLNLKNASSYYTPESIGEGYSMLSATRNGVPLTSEELRNSYEPNNMIFTFDKTGYYQIRFSAVNQNTNLPVKEEVYTFTILNGNESRYAYSFSGHKDYEITNVIFNNGYATFENDEIVASETYKNNTTSLWIAHSDATAGQWTITIDTGRKLTVGSDETTTFTFTFLIRSAKPPIEVSIPDGSSTKGEITVSFRAENVYNAVGDCYIYIMPEDASIENREPNFKINATTISEIGDRTVPINAEQGNFLIQVRTESGNLLYSYRVVKNKPMNGWDIALIVIGCVVGVGIIILIFLLRKRIKVK